MNGLVPFNKKDRSLANMSPKNPFNMIDDFFDEAFGDFPLLRRNLTTDPFKVDVREGENEYLIEAELPGAKKDEVDVELNDDGRLTIAVNQTMEFEEKKKDSGYIHRERRHDAMQRSLYLANAKADGISAKLEEGLLKITVEKKEHPDNQRKIEIE